MNREKGRPRVRDRPLIKNELLFGRPRPRIDFLAISPYLSRLSVPPSFHCISQYFGELRYFIRYPFDSSLSKDHGEQVPRLSTLDAQRVPARFSRKLSQPGLRKLLPPPVPVQQRIPPHRHADLARSSLAGLSQGESRTNETACVVRMAAPDRRKRQPRTHRNWGPKRPISNATIDPSSASVTRDNLE